MTTPTFIREVHVCSEYCDGASHAILYIPDDLYPTIKKAQRFVKKMKGNNFSISDYSPDFMDNKDALSDTPKEEDLVSNEDMRVECMELIITTDSVYWRGYIKHSEPPVEIYTESISIKEIDKAFKVLKSPIEDMPLYINEEKYSDAIVKIAKERLKNGT